MGTSGGSSRVAPTGVDAAALLRAHGRCAWGLGSTRLLYVRTSSPAIHARPVGRDRCRTGSGSLDARRMRRPGCCFHTVPGGRAGDPLLAAGRLFPPVERPIKGSFENGWRLEIQRRVLECWSNYGYGQGRDHDRESRAVSNIGSSQTSRANPERDWTIPAVCCLMHERFRRTRAHRVRRFGCGAPRGDRFRGGWGCLYFIHPRRQRGPRDLVRPSVVDG